jgi:hypothetical protein
MRGKLRISDNTPIQLSPDKSVSLSGIVDVGTNGNKAWDNVNETVDISKGDQLPSAWQTKIWNATSWDNKLTELFRD